MSFGTTQSEIGPGTLIGEIEIERLLGEGGMGKVFLGRAPEGLVAVKFMRREHASQRNHQRRFRREADAAAAAVSDHVVSILRTDEWEGMPYLVQPYASGGSLRDRLRDDERMSLAESIRICTEAGLGLGALHENGLIHRDVKPENILFGESDTCLISDFGLVKDPNASMLTVQGQSLGSPYYMAPEQIRGEDVVPATDVYSLACVVFECLVGHSPFSHTSGIKTLWAHLREGPPDACVLRDDLPAAVGSALTKGMAKEIDQRPPTPSRLAGMLRGEGPSSSDPGR